MHGAHYTVLVIPHYERQKGGGGGGGLYHYICTGRSNSLPKCQVFDLYLVTFLFSIYHSCRCHPRVSKIRSLRPQVKLRPRALIYIFMWGASPSCLIIYPTTYQRTMNTETLQHIQENIALLSLLNREPGAPSTEKLDDYASRETAQDTSSRCIPLNREYEIAECLAFLSGTTDDPKKVTALSIEENEGGSSLVIRIATNSGVDDKLWCQFQMMAQALQTASNCG